jgi:hypothetical protein
VGYPWQAAVNETCGLVDRSDRQADATGDGSILAHRASSANFLAGTRSTLSLLFSTASQSH